MGISRLYVLLGNGFTIDLINRIGKSDTVDVRNLFTYGAEVPWPGTQLNGFLSYKYCKALWTLGARTNMNTEESMKLIEDIITCINVYNLSRQQNAEEYQEASDTNIYIQAYGELTTYLRYLFIFYNSKITDEDLIRVEIPFITYLRDSLTRYDDIVIVNYNYDIFLERLLTINGINFNIEGFQSQTSQIKIIKPHGSISFSFNVKIEGPFTIRNSEADIFSQDVGQFQIKYDISNDFPIVNAIIPPAGDSNRVNMGWVKLLRERIIQYVEQSHNRDKLVIFGISYWHVDRAEIDEILTKLNPNIDAVLINPNPPTSFNAVLTSLFKNFVHYQKSDSINNSRIQTVPLEVASV